MLENQSFNLDYSFYLLSGINGQNQSISIQQIPKHLQHD